MSGGPGIRRVRIDKAQNIGVRDSASKVPAKTVGPCVYGIQCRKELSRDAPDSGRRNTGEKERARDINLGWIVISKEGRDTANLGLME